MSVQDIMDRARDVATANRVFGEPIHENGVTIIPAAKVGGGGGGGEGSQPGDKGQGAGGGLGMVAQPIGAFVVRGDNVTWRPVVDVNRAILIGAVMAMTLLATLRTIIRIWARRSRI